MAATRWIKCSYCGKRISDNSRTRNTPCRKSPSGVHDWNYE